MAKKKALVKQNNELMKLANNYTGYEDVSQTDLSIPFLKIAQKNSAQADKNNSAYIKGLKLGEFFNNVSCQNFGNELRVIPLNYFKIYIEWGKTFGEFLRAIEPVEFDKMRGGLEQEGTKWKTEDDHKIVDTRNYFVFLPDFPDEGILLFPLPAGAAALIPESGHPPAPG